MGSAVLLTLAASAWPGTAPGAERGPGVLQGDLVLADTALPVAGASIVIYDGGGKYEARTDERGSFRVEGLPVDRPLVCVGRAVDTNQPPRYRFERVLGQARIRGPAKTHQVHWQIPALRRLGLALPAGGIAPAPGAGKDYPVYSAERLGTDGAFRPGDLEDFQVDSTRVTLAVGRPGTWRLVAHAGPFLRQVTTRAEIAADEFSGEVRLEKAAATVETVEVVLMKANGRPAANQPVVLITAVPGAPELNAVTDAQGRLRFGPVNVPDVRLVVLGPASNTVLSVPATGKMPVVLQVPF